MLQKIRVVCAKDMIFASLTFGLLPFFKGCSGPFFIHIDVVEVGEDDGSHVGGGDEEGGRGTSESLSF